MEAVTRRCSVKKLVNNFSKWTGKDLPLTLFSKELYCMFTKKRSSSQVFSFEFYETFQKNIYAKRHLRNTMQSFLLALNYIYFSFANSCLYDLQRGNVNPKNI